VNLRLLAQVKDVFMGHTNPTFTAERAERAERGGREVGERAERGGREVGRRSVSVGVKGCYSVTVNMSGLSVDGEECYFILCTCVRV
jgi:hypothetical protein